MRDQAAELRNLVGRAARDQAARAGPRPRLVAISGGKGGVGATTLAVNLSIALSHQGLRVVLVDADLYRADVAALCGLPEQRSVNDVLSARRDIHEVLERGPAGVQVVPGLWAPGAVAGCSEMAQRRLLNQFHMLGRHADAVILDVGGGSSEVARRFWEAADEVLVVTTSDGVSVMDSYATIKTLSVNREACRVQIIVNQAADEAAASDVHRRIDLSCRRFLGYGVHFLGWIPRDEAAGQAAQRAEPLLICASSSPAARAVELLAASLAGQSPQWEGRRGHVA